MVNRHYHVLTAPMGVPLTDLTFDEYEESLFVFMKLANAMFRELRGSDYDLSLGQALAATAYGEARGAYCGPPSLTLYWLRCEEEVHSIPSWN